MSGIVPFSNDGAQSDRGAYSQDLPPAGSISGADFATGSITADVLLTIEITLRELFCGSWFREADLGFIFGERGAARPGPSCIC